MKVRTDSPRGGCLKARPTTPLDRAMLIDDVGHEVSPTSNASSTPASHSTAAVAANAWGLAPMGDAAVNYLEDVRAQTFQ